MATIRTKKNKHQFIEYLDFDFARLESDGSMTIRLKVTENVFKFIDFEEREVAELKRKLSAPSV